MPKISDARILIISARGFEQDELIVPRDRLREAGAHVDVASPDGQPIRGWDHTDWGKTVNADVKIGDADPSKYDALVIPGGQINPDLLRVNDEAMKIVRAFLNDGSKVVAAVCHAPWVLVQAGAVQGLQLTSYHSIRKDVENAGGKWIDREAVVDRGIVTSRNPDDLEAFSKTIIQEVEKDGQKRQPMAA